MGHLIMTHITLIDLKRESMVLMLASSVIDFYMSRPNKYMNSCSHQAKLAMHLLNDQYGLHKRKQKLIMFNTFNFMAINRYCSEWGGGWTLKIERGYSPF